MNCFFRREITSGGDREHEGTNVSVQRLQSSFPERRLHVCNANVVFCVSCWGFLLSLWLVAYLTSRPIACGACVLCLTSSDQLCEAVDLA